MQMVDLVPRRHDAAVRDLIVHAVGYPTPEKLDRVLEQFAAEPGYRLVGFQQVCVLDGDEQSGLPGADNQAGLFDGILGYELHGSGRATILRIAVRPEVRRQGIGRHMVRWLQDEAGLTQLTAETECHAVGFYRRLGFSIVSLGELWPGTERFRCTLTSPATTTATGASGLTDPPADQASSSVSRFF